MNKAFTKEDAPDAPLIVPPRAPLPDGIPNYVTARGLTLLRSELAALEAERAALAAAGGDDAERARRVARESARITELGARLASAELVDPRRQPHDEVRFGATVTVRDDAGDAQHYTIVGVDEADPATGRIAFLAPVACALHGARVGDVVTVRTGRGEQSLDVLAIEYSNA